MSNSRFFRIYYLFLKYLGLLSVRYDSENNYHVFHVNMGFYAIYGCWQCLYLISFGILLMKKEDQFNKQNSTVENYSQNALLIIAVILNFVTNGWLAALQGVHFHIISQCERTYNRWFSDRKSHLLSYSTYLLALVIIVCGLYVSHICKSWIINVKEAGWMYVPIVCYTIYNVVSSILLVGYIFLIHVLMELLDFLASSTEKLTSNKTDKPFTDHEIRKLQEWLLARDTLLLLCTQDISVVYGVILLINAFFATLNITSTIHKMLGTTSIQEVGEMVKVVTDIVLWLMPSSVFLTLALACNNIQNKANKTTKILANIRRTGTGLDKMLNKFLLKNLRPKPILTAYGFFGLDRSTLFKLLTAIFTYMMILVQFKEIENTARRTV